MREKREVKLEIEREGKKKACAGGEKNGKNRSLEK